MKMVGRPFQRPNKPGWWIRWTEGGRRIVRNFHTKGQADYYRSVLYQRLNSDYIPGAIPASVKDALQEYLSTFTVRGLAPKSKKEAAHTLNLLIEETGLLKTSGISQKTLDQFIEKRLSTVSRSTVNKDIRNIRAFLNWCRKQHYIRLEFTLHKVKTEPKIVKALTTDQIRSILAVCGSPEWKIRILLSLTTGLRKNDLDGLPAASVDFRTMTVDTTSQKTRKAMPNRPLPAALKPILREYLKGRTGPLFNDINRRKAWDALRIKAKLPHLTRQDFRRTFATLMQTVGGIGTAQRLLEHSDSRVTGQFYTDLELVERWKVNQLPVKDWLKKEPPTRQHRRPR